MCLIAWNWQPDAVLESRLLLLSNRDEYHARPALPLDWWEDSQVLAGRDLQAGGAWLGVDRQGRLAALTNYRQPTLNDDSRPSRGALVAGFLQGRQDAPDYLQSLLGRANSFNPFNLLVYDGKQLLGLESRHRRIVELQPGPGAVSNADFHTPWPKLQRLQSALQMHWQSGRTAADELLPLLQDRTLVDDAELPHTGVPLEWERRLSATFVVSEHYGTRASSVVHLGPGGTRFAEQSYDAQGLPVAKRVFAIS